MLKLLSSLECCRKKSKIFSGATEVKHSNLSSLLPVTSFEMIVGGHGDVNPNSSWLNGKGFWLSYGLGVLLLHLILLCLPFISTAVSWTLTNCIHNLFMLIFLHIVKGAPFEPLDQGKTRSLTHWEQIDYGKRFTVTRKFLTVVPVILFVLTSFYTKYDTTHFIVNIIALVAVLLPKLPHFHRVWLFDSNDHSY
ncbi:ORM1-like protein 3 [Daphnia pulex]|nr:ORM1-like protein 3 [Daphnia pulex]